MTQHATQDPAHLAEYVLDSDSAGGRFLQILGLGAAGRNVGQAYCACVSSTLGLSLPGSGRRPKVPKLLVMMQSRALVLSTKPGARLRYSTLPASPEHGPFSTTLLVFLNGLLLPRSSWIAAIDSLVATRSPQQRPVPHLLTYDRYGQGDSDPDPTDDPRSPYGHDARDVVADLHRFLLEACDAHLPASLDDMTVVFVANSIGCPLARLYAAEHPGRVSAYVFLDSMMANTDFVSLFPDPDAPATLPAGITVDELRKAREGYRRMFHPTVPNPEHFDRRNLPILLPEADGPQLPADPKNENPYLIIVGHDPDEFAEQGETFNSPEKTVA
ncbi:hypothetical protein SLS55_000642 [Diplodia seriata]|uniref:AB hydrolase-1 domain-containing protein n=1 Tax=Diplodia seriata TaxID=420778 RepID=A0ABR3CUW1_9PEZI